VLGIYLMYKRHPILVQVRQLHHVTAAGQSRFRITILNIIIIIYYFNRNRRGRLRVFYIATVVTCMCNYHAAVTSTRESSGPFNPTIIIFALLKISFWGNVTHRPSAVHIYTHTHTHAHRTARRRIIYGI